MRFARKNFDQRLLYYRDELNLCLRNLKTSVKHGEVLEREAKIKKKLFWQKIKIKNIYPRTSNFCTDLRLYQDACHTKSHIATTKFEACMPKY
jgi:hypothetical protein